MKKTIITKEALQYLTRIVWSCVAACAKSNESFKVYVKQAAAENKDLDYGDFAARFSDDIKFLKEIQLFAQKHKKKVIDAALVFQYFGGGWHIKKVLSDIKKHLSDNPVLQGRAARSTYLFDHILTLHYIKKSKKGVVCGYYQNPYNSQYAFLNLRFKAPAPNSEIAVGAGDRALLHFGEVVAVNPSDKIAKFIFREQKKNKEFMKAVQYLSRKGG